MLSSDDAVRAGGEERAEPLPGASAHEVARVDRSVTVTIEQGSRP
jgi:hypothetical protein